MTDPSQANGVWIFVSHSNLDLEKVRQVRDALEKDGHNPILFFLKCLTVSDPRLPQLIKDEIAARTWFVLCRSANSEHASWVREEVEIVTSTKPKETFVAINLETELSAGPDGVPAFVKKLRPLLKRATVFLSYERKDRTVAADIAKLLTAEDFRVLDELTSIGSGGFNIMQQVRSEIEDALDHGFVLLLLSPEYLNSVSCQKEREEAFAILGTRPLSNIVPVIVRDPQTVYRQLPANLSHLQCLDVSRGGVAQNVAALLHHLKTTPMA
jgi:hypothetical protein